jgi:hypothetical protein
MLQLQTFGHSNFAQQHVVQVIAFVASPILNSIKVSIRNTRAGGLPHLLGLTNLGETYSDEDGLEWQNLIRRNNAH